MGVHERIGLDLGAVSNVVLLAVPAAEVGASIVRVAFPLGKLAAPDAEYLDQAASAMSLLESAGFCVLAVVDGRLTVAPDGMGTFAESPPEQLAAAWTAELTANTRALASAISSSVRWWEVLPEPNTGTPPRIAPGRWASLLADVGACIREADPTAKVIAGGLASDESDDGADYLRSVYRAAESLGFWQASQPPFDHLAIRLRVLPDGGPSGETVAAALAERTRRVARVAEMLEGSSGRGVMVNGISWEAERVGEDVQARNLWTAFNTLTADPTVVGVVWSGIVDRPTSSCGLYRADSMEDPTGAPHGRRSQTSAPMRARSAPRPALRRSWQPRQQGRPRGGRRL